MTEHGAGQVVGSSALTGGGGEEQKPPAVPGTTEAWVAEQVGWLGVRFPLLASFERNYGTRN